MRIVAVVGQLKESLFNNKICVSPRKSREVIPGIFAGYEIF